MTSDDVPLLGRSRADQAVTWYRGELELRRLVAALAFPALLALTGFGLVVEPGSMSLLMAVLTFIAGAELVTTGARLRERERRARRASLRGPVGPVVPGRDRVAVRDVALRPRDLPTVHPEDDVSIR